MPHDVRLVTSDSDIEACFDAFSALRPHLTRAEFLSRVKHQQRQSYEILAVAVEGKFPAAAGFRILDFLAWGKVLYIDDLTTVPEARGRGYASQLLEWLVGHAKAQRCAAVHLDTGYGRHDAHRLYLKVGFKLQCHHMALQL
jgi:GNAT superfamily N-acetyltransferase